MNNAGAVDSQGAYYTYQTASAHPHTSHNTELPQHSRFVVPTYDEYASSVCYGPHRGLAGGVGGMARRKAPRMPPQAPDSSSSDKGHQIENKEDNDVANLSLLVRTPEIRSVPLRMVTKVRKYV